VRTESASKEDQSGLDRVLDCPCKETCGLWSRLFCFVHHELPHTPALTRATITIPKFT
jgi:hypothetical protein